MNSLENAVLTTVKAFPKIPSSVGAIIDARMTASPDASSTPKLSFEDWLSYVVNAKFLGSTLSSPFTGVQWRGLTNPTQRELSWLVEKLGKAIFAECALILPDTGSYAAAAADITPHLAFLAKLIVTAISAALTSSHSTTTRCSSRP
jgi:hypothetical protein